MLPFVKNQHWVFRVPEFIKIQLLLFQVIASIGLFIFTGKSIWVWLIALFQIGLIIYHTYLLARFTKFYKKHDGEVKGLSGLKVISTNIYQFNQEFGRFKDFIRKEKPDIFVTIESNKDWELALREMEADYPYTEKITLENTYGMHLYAKAPFQKVTTHYFVSEDLPSIEAHFKTKDGDDFVLFCVHPPPPSPTEEETSKERDGDLLCIAKRTKEIDKPTLVVGDFNTVAWSKISELFRENSGLIDGRMGRGILASYHAKYWFFRTPLDLIFHSPSIFLKELSVLEHIGSDHFPISCTFCIDSSDCSQEEEVETITKEEREETEELISEGKKEESDNRSV
ncbi:endonuclease/exonuclease/phosphatase family protein [Roseivirga sp.]|uniref:endonuclease/exonuclease/phosphatase family protein n=1 Tax=Roseivirga sp. TaxID=1964215 RepID=UPI002B266D6C|nr:endonuclease/exonuclease/phosphatase family protein [Roseivirga sp.]